MPDGARRGFDTQNEDIYRTGEIIGQAIPEEIATRLFGVLGG
jgi:hypothetical protein